ncbi:DUF4912 domain-containing protein [Leptolyngbya sp. FACHB-17]|uniref:DUF4912 domain-containing protein n=1 Tax=unclassified Leptolyngbya TaxID=2650499 RepID=UPI0016802C99|nr:DUF4912 domain-containing protein [Leptolyngbya sp. FACHB-17]MBD2083061.1 DUF4912 domain-containing protein [Leptolyngbya sp. FACHB-17]
MVHKNYSSTVGLTLLLTTATVVDVQWVRAQSPAFQLPASVAQGTNVRVDGSSSMAAVNTVLKQRFEQQFPGTKVSLAANGASTGIQSVLNGKTDIAAIARPLTEAEKAQGLKSVPMGRDKIAIIVGANNPFAKSLTINQFARIFRGEVKNWSQVGGQNTPIKLVDRPDGSDTRQAFKEYPAFKQGKFTTGTTALKLKQDTIQAVAANLGNNGISYATANQLKNRPGVRAIAMDGVKPTDARYPFSQSLYYVYKDGANPAVQAFLGLATSAPGQTAIAKAGVAEKNPGEKSATTGAASSGSREGDGNPLAFLFPRENTAGTTPETGLPHWLWWLLPIGSGAALLWMLARGRRPRPAATRDRLSPPDQARNETGSFTPPPYSSDPDAPSVNGAPYVEGGFDPLHNANGMSAPSLGEAPSRQPSNFDFAPKDTTDRAFGNLSADSLALGAGAATWAAFSNRPNQSRVVLKSRSSQEVEAFWDIPNDERQAARQQGGEKLALRLYDVTNIDLSHQSAHSVQQIDCDELTQRQRLPIGLSDRDYLVEIGYLTGYNQWLSLARSTHVRVPAANPGSVRSTTVTSSDAIAPDAVDSAKAVLSDDRDIENTAVKSATTEFPTEAPQPSTESPSWLQQMTDRVTDTASNVTQAGGAAATGAGTAAWSFISGRHQADAPRTAAPPPETASFTTDTTPESNLSDSFVTGETIAPAVQPEKNEGRLILTPRNSRWAYATWDLPRSLRSRINLTGSENLVLRLYDVTESGASLPERYEQLDIDDMALSCDVPIPMSDRTYVAEVGYVDVNQQWTRLARSTPAHVSAN